MTYMSCDDFQIKYLKDEYRKWKSLPPSQFSDEHTDVIFIKIDLQCKSKKTIDIFRYNFAIEFSKKFAIKYLSFSPPHVNCVAPLPCEMWKKKSKIVKIWYIQHNSYERKISLVFWLTVYIRKSCSNTVYFGPFCVCLWWTCRRIVELEDVLERMEDEHKQELNKVTSKFQDKITEGASVRLDAERLRVSSSLPFVVDLRTKNFLVTKN